MSCTSFARSIEGLLYINRDSVDFSQVSVDRVADHLDSVAPGRDKTHLTAAHLRECLLAVYNTARGEGEREAPHVITFIEARFWVMCGARFEALAALVSFTPLKITFDESSHGIHNGITHYAQAVGSGMRSNMNHVFQMRGTEVEARQYEALSRSDPEALMRRRIMVVGDDTIEFMHLAEGYTRMRAVSKLVRRAKRG